LRATFNELASSRSLGKKLPAANDPESIKLLSCSLIWLVRDSGFFLLTRMFVFTCFPLLDNFVAWFDSSQRQA
jgi:hypothetical protein